MAYDQSQQNEHTKDVTKTFVVPNVAKQGLGYLLVGGSSAVLELGLFQLLFEILHLPLAVSNVSATAVAATYNFLLNRNVTFKSSSNPLRSAVLFVLLLLCNMAITTFLIGKLVTLGVHSGIAKVLTQGLVVCWNFILYRKLIFI